MHGGDWPALLASGSSQVEPVESSTAARLCVDLLLLLAIVALRYYQAHAQTLPPTAQLTRIDRFEFAVFVLILIVLCYQVVERIMRPFLIMSYSADAAVWFDIAGWASCLLGWTIYTAWQVRSYRTLLRTQQARMRERLKALTAQHDHEVDVEEGARYPGAPKETDAGRSPLPPPRFPKQQGGGAGPKSMV